MPHLKLSENAERPSWELLARSILNPYVPQNKTIMLSRLQKAMEEKKAKEAEAAFKRKRKKGGFNNSSSSDSEENDHQKHHNVGSPSKNNKSSKVWWSNSIQRQKTEIQGQKQTPRVRSKNMLNAKMKGREIKKKGNPFAPPKISIKNHIK